MIISTKTDFCDLTEKIKHIYAYMQILLAYVRRSASEIFNGITQHDHKITKRLYRDHLGNSFFLSYDRTTLRQNSVLLHKYMFHPGKNHWGKPPTHFS